MQLPTTKALDSSGRLTSCSSRVLCLGHVKITNRECLMLAGLNNTKLMLKANTFWKVFWLAMRAQSPCSPTGKCWLDAWLEVAQPSPNSRLCLQYSATSADENSTPTSVIMYASTRCGCKIGNVSTAMRSVFSSFTGSLMVSISLTMEITQQLVHSE